MFKEYEVRSAASGSTIAFYGINANINKVIKDMNTNGYKLSSELNYDFEPIQAEGERIVIWMA